jgi:glycosyltransferase involved in cell wall biosynthesis
VLGRLPLEAVPQHIAEASIYCMPSKVEPFGIAVIEAARSGLPVVTTAVGGMLETVLPDRTGFLVEPGDVDALERALRTLLADPALCQRMGREGTSWTEQFSWDAVSGRIVGKLADAMASQTRSADSTSLAGV